ncbi:MAG: PorV/PorQ family protein [Sphingobacteriales bacterium]|nr:PorV/PorQ family protein [Sphingobacteriales bacterium]
MLYYWFIHIYGINLYAINYAFNYNKILVQYVENNHIRQNWYIGVLLTLFFPQVAAAQFRQYSNEFLNIGAGARGLAMGGAQVASVNDATAGYWNPAGLTGVKDVPAAALMHADYFSGIGKYDFGAVAIPIQDNKRTLGLSVLRFAVDDIPNTLYLVEPDGSINYNNVQSFSSADYALLLSFAEQAKKTEFVSISYGVNAKVIYRKVGTFATALGFGIDAGVQMKGDNWQLGVVVKDLTTTFNAWSFHFTDQEKEKLYLTNNNIPVKSTESTAPHVTLGGRYTFKAGETFSISPEASLDFTFEGRRNTVVSSNAVNIDPHVGLEASLKDIFFVRAGVTNFQRGLADGDTLNQKRVWIYQPSFGAGIKIKNVSIDYAFTNLANQSNPLYTHVLSLCFNLKSKPKEEAILY